jgi:hypothetical protein
MPWQGRIRTLNAIAATGREDSQHELPQRRRGIGEELGVALLQAQARDEISTAMGIESGMPGQGAVQYLGRSEEGCADELDLSV